MTGPVSFSASQTIVRNLWMMKPPAVEADPLLVVEDRPAGGQLDQDGDDEHERREDRTRSRAETTISVARLTSSGAPLSGTSSIGDHREPVEVLDVGLEGQELEEVGDEPDVDGILVDDPERLDDLGVVVRNPGRRKPRKSPYSSMTGPSSAERPEDLDARRRPRRPSRLRDRRPRSPGPGIPGPGSRELLGDGLPHVARADDEDVGQVRAPGHSAAS